MENHIQKIFDFADDYMWMADYYEPATGYIYNIIEGNIKFNKTKIRVVSQLTGQTVGYLVKDKNKE